MLKRPLQIGCVVLTLLLAACSSAPATPAASSAPSVAAATTATTAAADAAFPVTVTDAYGSVTVAQAPQRVVVLADEMAEIAVALGIKPVGLGSTRIEMIGVGDPFAMDTYYLTPEQIGQPVFVGGQEPNLEAVAATQPDLILYLNYDQTVYEQLGQIAPTLAVDTTERGGWKQAIMVIGQATGRAEQAQTVIADFDARLREAQAMLVPVVTAHPRIMLLYPEYRGTDQNFVFGEAFALAGTLTDLGFTLVGAGNGEAVDAGVFPISPEVYPTIETDTIITLSTPDRRTTSSTPILESLAVPILNVVVENGRPSTGPLSERYYLDSYADVLTQTYGDAVTTATTTASGATFPLRITHAQGETTLARPVSRVVAIGDEVADIVIASGMEPVGVGTARLTSELGQPITNDGYLDLGEAVFVGDGQAPSVEAIAALKPDLIMYLDGDVSNMYDQLSAIAPTIAIDSNPKEYWRQVMTDLGQAAGTAMQVQQFFADYDATVQAARAQVAPLVQEAPNLALLYSPDEASTFVFDDRSSVTSPYVNLGFTIVATEDVEIPDSGFAQVSAEAVTNIEADTIVALRFVDDAGAPLPIDAILNSLPDVRVVTQPLDPSRSSSAPITDKQAIEQAAALLAGNEAQP